MSRSERQPPEASPSPSFRSRIISTLASLRRLSDAYDGSHPAIPKSNSLDTVLELMEGACRLFFHYACLPA